jgi:quercetin 2,3-dioxygenase
MKRRKFILSSLSATPLVVSGAELKSTERSTKGFVVKAGSSRFAEKTKIGGLNPVDLKVSQKDTDGMLSISEYTGFTKGGPPLHIHPNQDEMFIILEGEHLFQLGDEQYHLMAGDTIFIPRNVPHAPAQLSERGKYLFFFTPSGQMDDFFRVLGNLPVTGQPSPEQMAKLFETHGMKIVGPPLTVK